MPEFGSGFSERYSGNNTGIISGNYATRNHTPECNGNIRSRPGRQGKRICTRKYPGGISPGGRTGGGYVQNYVLTELKALWFNNTHPEFTDAVIPTLREVLWLLKPTGLTINIELKTSIILYKGIEERVLALVKEAQMEHRVIYSSFHHASLVKIKKLEPKAMTGLLYSDGWLHVLSYAKKINMDALHPPMYHMKSKKLARREKDKKLAIHVWTVDEETHMRFLLEQKVDAIITNKPDLCRMVVDGGRK